MVSRLHKKSNATKPAWQPGTSLARKPTAGEAARARMYGFTEEPGSNVADRFQKECCCSAVGVVHDGTYAYIYAGCKSVSPLYSLRLGARTGTPQ